MKGLIFTIFLVHLGITKITCNLTRKCCGRDYQMVQNISKYSCEKLSNPRLQENFGNKNYFAKHETGSCVEILSEEKLGIFRINKERKIEKIQDLEINFFPKCCLLGSIYNTTTHSCQRNDTQVINLLKMDSFVRVGLPKCEIISDKVLDKTDVRKDGKSLILLKEDKELVANYCVDATPDDKLVVRVCESDYQICSKIMCIHKCCPDGQSFINRSDCKDTLKHGIDLTFTKAILAPRDPFVIIHGFKPRIHKMSWGPNVYFVDRFGTFSAYINKTDSFDNFEVSNSTYCIEHTVIEKNNTKVTNKYIMFGSASLPSLAIKFAVTRWIKLVSCFFLIFTILIYLLLPKMRNLFGKILLNYCVATLIFFSSLAVSQFYSQDFGDGICIGMGFVSVVSSIWSFTWLNIMCIDIWRSFGTPRTLSGRLQKKEWKMLLQYCLYGWGFPLIWVSMIAVFSVTTMMPEAIHPVIGDQKCYLENSDSRPGNYSYITYVTLPLLLQQIVNTVLFIKTILYCLRIKKEIERMNDCETRTAMKASKERLGLIVKLAVIMGIFFIFETVSSIYNFRQNDFTTHVEVVWDSINCMQGVFIFIIFICKKKVYNNICDKIPGMQSRKISVTSTTATQVSTHNMPELKSLRERK